MQSIVPRIFELTANWTGPVLAGLLVLVNPAQSQRPDFKEYEIKAVFLFNFVHFVEWPPEAFSTPESPIVIGIFGDDPFGKVLDQAVQGEKVQNRAILVRRFAEADELNECHLLFIGLSEQYKVARALRRVENQLVLTVSDARGFIEQGGAINFYIENKKVRFEVNAEILRKDKLRISSQLLRLAKIVSPTSSE